MILRPQRGSLPRAARYAVIWLLLGGLTYLAFDTLVSTKVARPVVTDGSGVIVIERSHDQHFYVEGAINGHAVTFLVDTGASLVSVSAEFARTIALAPGAAAAFDTAGGRVVGQIVPAASVQVGGIRVDGIRIGVGTGEQALLGQNFLKKVRLTQDGNRLLLRASAAP